MTDGEEKQEIIIVRRVTGGDAGHHGGAWKIAFADFMTAMMALFLVLWLVNAANEKTKKSVASYFNPVKLIDRTRSTKGLDEATSSDSPKSEVEGDKSVSTNEKKESAPIEATIRDEDFFRDPFAVLDGIASQELERIENAHSVLEQEHAFTARTEDAFLDPFAQAIEQPKTEPPQPQLVEGEELDSHAPMVAKTPSDETAVESTDQQPPQKMLEVTSSDTSPRSPKEKRKTAKEKALSSGEKISSNPHMKPKPKESLKRKVASEPQEKTNADPDGKLEKVSAEIFAEIKKRLTKRLGEEEQISENLTVRVTEDGILISITDQFGFSMFQVGSAVPKGEIVLAMSEISGVLAERKGMVRIYGHTDARPYVGEDYDNWRLSTARAHSARLMLERGGLELTRVSQVVGFADRILRVPEKPESDPNRRIEILLEVS